MGEVKLTIDTILGLMLGEMIIRCNAQELFRGFRAVRVDYAGIPELERITEGEAALTDIQEYLSVILLWRD